MAGGGTTIEYTPTWVLLKKKNQRNLYEALQKIKEELMLLGFISLLLTVCQGFISKICIPKKLAKTWMPCRENQRTKLHPIHGIKKDDLEFLSNPSFHFHPRVGRHLLASESGEYYCKKQIRQWRKWEESIIEELQASENPVLERKLTNVREHDFVKNRFLGVGKRHAIIGWMNHCRTNPKFNFHNYVTRAFEADFKKVVGISWHLWVIVVIFLLANVQDLHAYFWISFVPLILLICVGTKLQHILTQLAQDVAEKHMAVEGDLVVKPSDDHFWLHKPKLVLTLIHIILFQNSFELAVFFWILVLCSYSILPLYAIVVQMGSKFKKAIFKENIQEGLIHWAKKARKNIERRNRLDGNLSRSSSLASMLSRSYSSTFSSFRKPSN
ncbi:hypothetical protein WN943_015740 [Citrus x changshan-huyou]